MKCPIDNSDLQMTDRQGIEIDYCPQCRGVWLDRGELDKLIDRSNEFASKPMSLVSPQQSPSYRESDDHYKSKHYDDDYHHGSYKHGHKRKEGFLGELFDF